MSSRALIRPAWTPATIALMVGGFFVFWPLGLAVLAYILWGERLDAFKRDVNTSTDRLFGGLKRSGFGGTAFGASNTGNVAFDDWRDAELKRLDDERRKLNEAAAEFEAHARELRRAKDQEEFDRFMKDRQAREKTRNDARNDGPIVDGHPA
ncbi:DUF2852 domain-containing protein [Fulvimarina sp. 2208YS6-2-32]|uniref:DUF2852 domain-containing protein n=1 Tax=Fulvimarina uroteuthidis TaxID=3098149 RepID=A0ABU5I129_9HYPH|nr:DUF2852 domain-containing protein [Fulvimarina sp. 2208YS6-2-32]MDY8109084.1 DUF2852 domain-containing protein [Fulvimarina sp. 2208YS6-2-32]